MKRVNMLTIALAILLAPSFVFAANAHQFAVGKAVAKDANNLVTVPLVVTNEDNLTAIDIPLTWNEGVVLKEVNYAGTRVEYFDLKIANIKNDDRTVVIGLLPQMTPTYKPDLAAGTGPVANLVFEVIDPTVDNISLETVVLENPGHFLCFVYHDFDPDGTPHSRVEHPEFTPVTMALSNVASEDPSVPTHFGLNQNYPNPFNPTTTIQFDVPKASHVKLEVFNVLGQNVRTLVDENLDAATHTVEFDASELGSGIYFYRIQADGFAETKKMALIK
jgi:hypothetical protein